ncbi:CBN-UNC-51 protein, partial [Aphelenchoides avenae]
SSERNAPTSFTFRASDLKRLFHMPISSWSTAMAVTLTPTSESTRNYESAQFRPSSGKSVKSLCKKRYVLCTILGKAMEVMLQHSVIHRDIKPQNILLCKGDPTASEVDLFDCTVKLTDFGAATMADRAASTVCGTFDYMAPEVIRCLAERRGSYDSKCDMFSVGVVLYQCVTGKHPFTRPTMMFGQSTDELTSMASDDSYQAPTMCSGEVQALLGQLLVAEPSERLGAGACFGVN